MARRSDTTAAVAARRAASTEKIERVVMVVKQMRAERAAITVAAVAARAGVSRTFLYENTEARAAVSAAITATAGNRNIRTCPDALDNTWRERALNAEASLKLAYDEIRQQRQRIGELLGQIRDLECDLPPDALQRLITENTSLRHQAHKLQQSNSDLEQRLTASRENVRFHDRTIAALQAEILELRGLAPSVPARGR